MSSKVDLRAVASQPVVSLKEFAQVQVAAGSKHADARRRATGHLDTVDNPNRTPQPLRRESKTVDFKTRAVIGAPEPGVAAVAAGIQASSAREAGPIVDDKANRHLPDGDPRKT